MGWFPQGRKSRWAGVDFAALVPERLVPGRLDPVSGRVVLWQPRFGDGPVGRFLQRTLPPGRRHVLITLEARGSYLWQLLDGQATVAELAGRLAAAMPSEKEALTERVSAYLYQMESNGWIRFKNLPD